MNDHSPNPAQLKQRITDALWSTVEEVSFIESATLAGSFLTGHGLEGISDIDLIVIVDHLNQTRFDALQSDFRAKLQPVLEDEWMEVCRMGGLNGKTLKPL